ncbi:MAG: carbohydrate ABC transporter permease [Armatimonadota bacterium]
MVAERAKRRLWFGHPPRRVVTAVASHAALAALGLLFVAPFVWLLSTSLKTEDQIFQRPPTQVLPLLAYLAPQPPTAENYRQGLTFVPFATYLLNTVIVCGMSVLGTLLSCSLVAYGLARIQWRGREALFYVLLGTMMLPYQVVMVPLFVVFAKIGWVDTWLPLWVPSFLGNALFIFLLRQFFLTIPRELTDAARIDGASELQIYSRIMLPLAKPALAVVALLSFLGAWNEYLMPLIYLSDDSKYTLSLGLAQFVSQYGSYWGWLMAASTIMTVPIMVLFFFTQRTFIQGISLTGIKG